MSTATKIEVMPDEKYIRDGLRDGTITRQELSLTAALVLDHSHFQARAEHYDMGHVRRLGAIRDTMDGKPLAPIMTFFRPDPLGYLTADGFHRVREAQIRGDRSIPAWVAKVPDPERAALEFATMCNRTALLVRKPEDIKRAVWMLLDDEVWFGRSDSWIADHVGAASGTAAKYRMEYCKSRNVDFPKNVLGRRGALQPFRRTPLEERAPNPSSRRRNYNVSVGGHQINLGTDLVEATRNMEKIKAVRRMLAHPSTLFRNWLAQRKIYVAANVSTASVARFDVFGFRCDDRLLVTADLTDSRAMVAAVGRAVLLKELAGSPHPPIIVCFPEEGCAELIEAGRRLGIEFLTPEELVERFKGESP